MRAGWLATVSRIDWPTTPMNSVTAANIAAQKAEFTAILDSVKAANMNAVLFQIRPETDAFYNSAYEPWSANLGGTRGTYPGYDPLAFAIEEAHKRGIELHGWINPYRFETSAKKYSGAVCDYKATHPEWILDYAVYNANGTKKTDGVTILDPGNPAVRKLIKNVIGDILSKYDVDGILFDDYFYAYAGTSSTLDSYSQNLYKPSSMTRSDWRRDNVNKMVADVYDTIQAVRPSVIFGVAPFGIWTTSSSVATAQGLTLPTGITGSNMYEQIYCDPVAWLEQGKVDYISPQLYWTTTSTGQDYKKLCPWWSDVANKYSKYFYSSMSLTDLTSTYNAPKYSPAVFRSDIPADLPELKLYTRNGGLQTGLTQTEQRVAAANAYADSEVGLEIDWNRNSTKNAAPGNVFYSIKNLQTKGNFTRYLREQKFTSPALTPAINWKSHVTLTAPSNVIINGNTLNWDFSQPIVRFVIYAIPNAQVGNSSAFATVTNIIGISYTNEFDLTKYISKFTTHEFAVAALDRYGNEFTPAYSTYTAITKQMNDDVRISINNGSICVNFSGKAIIELFTISGTILHTQISEEEYSRKLVHGAYLLRINGKTHKIII